MEIFWGTMSGGQMVVSEQPPLVFCVQHVAPPVPVKHDLQQDRQRPNTGGEFQQQGCGGDNH
jgi:hypothetical protein